MNNRVSFQTKLMFNYSFFTIVLLLALCFGFYMYNAYLFEKNSINSLYQVVSKTSQQLDNCVNEMDKISIQVISDEELIRSLTNISLTGITDSNDIRILNDALVVKVQAVYRNNIYRASIFNSDGYYFTSRLYDELDKNATEKISKLAWIGETRKRNGSKYLLLPHLDNWVSSNGMNVFSLVRLIRNPGNEVGFIEIQQYVSKLKQICDIQDSSISKVMVVDQFGRMVYSKFKTTPQEIQYYTNIIHKTPKQHTIEIKSLTGATEIISFQPSDYTGWTVIAIQDKKELLAPLMFIRNITIVIGLGIIVITLFFFFIFAKQLTTPLKELKKTIEDITISNLPEPMPIEHENNEIEALNQAFRKMRDRLNQAIEREIKSQSLQMKAHFDALQAQINPHFIYNMLTILGNMGDEAGQEEISVTCLKLAKILRYSTSTEKAWATMREEMNHTVNYLSLMKRRFEHRLEYNIDIAEGIMDFPIPKLTIQPLVENSISHGFENSPDTMKIVIKGGFVENGWQISIIDNGSGFAPEILENLREKIDYYTANLISNQKDTELSIGGMGLISTFARLLLLYGTELRFELKNIENSGACINIGGSINKTGKEGILNV